MSTRVKVGTLFLNNSTGFAVAGGAATGESTTPWATRDANWTPQAPKPLAVWGGGPPFVAGRTLAYQSYDDVTEQIPLFLDATSHDDAANELQLLRTEVLRTVTGESTILEIKPDGATNSMYANIKTGWLQEETILESPVGGALRMRATLTIIRTPFFGRLSTGETLINALAFKNTGTGSPSNVRAFSAGVGDLIYEGSPLNCAIVLPAASAGPPAFITKVWVASIYSRTYSTTFSGTKTTSDTADGDVIGSSVSVSLTDALSKNLSARFMARLASASANAQFRVQVTMGPVIYTGPWVDNVGTATQLLDLGGFSLREIIRRSKGLTAPTMSVQFYIRSVSGSVSGNVTYGEVLLYYTFCELNLTQAAESSPGLLLDTFAEQTSVPCLPFQSERVITVSGTSFADIVRKKGRLPRYVSGASLYLAWMDDVTGDHTTTEQATATVTHAPLWKTFRGGA